MLRYFRNLGVDGTLVWLLGTWILPAIVGSKTSRKHPLWLLAIAPWAIAWSYPMGLYDNPFQDSELWGIGPLVYAASVFTVIEITTENARGYITRTRMRTHAPKHRAKRSDR